MTPHAWLICALWGGSAAGLAWYASTVARQLTYVTLADGRRQLRVLPLIFRILLPLTPNLEPFFGRAMWAKTREKDGRRIVAAGYDGLLTPSRFMALKILMPIIFGSVWCFVVWAATSTNDAESVSKAAPAFFLIGPLWFFLYPSLWLRRMLKQRHTSIQRALPFVLDVMTLSVEAGMDFMTALQRNIERRKLDALNEELITVIREIQLGKTRRVALREMSQRVNLADLRSVVNALVQADELGVSIGSILRIQADQIRQRRFERAEKLANEAPVKMLFPLMVFIFPSVFLILLGPVIARLLEQGF